ncbi:hypothetical protein Rsub_10797 [Raphidocelis subcapitata]|uniref:DAPG hydrolase PhiG domain-containing protein n=1 Tax=Raphidocelis subcapitata TaxID=307507 RepID=A0A2V0PFI6_9CHLO|nr:hypothetical protein Rsub_10797 [Raphidocelis subcapitata]|eukprot:GBF98608.1 hypothetical protein Rsub_10797 [Raphidocelis subcapitata]
MARTRLSGAPGVPRRAASRFAAWLAPLVLVLALCGTPRPASAAAGITALRCELDGQGKLANIRYKVGDAEAWKSVCKWNASASEAVQAAGAGALGDICLDDVLAIIFGIIGDAPAKGSGAAAGRPEGVVLRGADGDLRACGSLGGGGGALGALGAGSVGVTQFEKEGRIVSGIRAQCEGKAGSKRIKSLKPKFSKAPKDASPAPGPSGVPKCCIELMSYGMLHPGETSGTAFPCCSNWIKTQGASAVASGDPAAVEAAEAARAAALKSGLSAEDAETQASVAALFGDFGDTCPPDESKGIWAPPITRCDLPSPRRFNNIDGDTVDPRTGIPTTKYLLWHPKAHMVQQTVLPSGVPGNATGAYWYIRELFMPRVRYFRSSQPPPDWSWDFFCNIVLHVIKLTGNSLEMGFQIGGGMAPPIRLTHEWTDSREGLLVVSRMFYGYQEYALLDAAIVRMINFIAIKSFGGDCPQEAAWKWVNHCIEEIGNLEFFLPTLYKQAVGK